MSSDIQLNNPYPIPIDTRIYQLRFKILEKIKIFSRSYNKAIKLSSLYGER